MFYIYASFGDREVMVTPIKGLLEELHAGFLRHFVGEPVHQKIWQIARETLFLQHFLGRMPFTCNTFVLCPRPPATPQFDYLGQWLD